MSSRDIWSKGGGDKVQDLLSSLFATQLLGRQRTSPLYLCSPYLSDFNLYDNAFLQFGSLFTHATEFSEQSNIRFSDVLWALSRLMQVRIVTIKHPSSSAFLQRLTSNSNADIVVRLADAIYHEKGLLCDDFYIEGSMNFTYSGVLIRDEKVTCHIGSDPAGKQKIDAAFLEFDRRWKQLASRSQPRGPA